MHEMQAVGTAVCVAQAVGTAGGRAMQAVGTAERHASDGATEHYVFSSMLCIFKQ